MPNPKPKKNNLPIRSAKAKVEVVKIMADELDLMRAMSPNKVMKDKPSKQRRIKAWAITDKKTGEICHYLDGKQLYFWRYKTGIEKEYPKEIYKATKILITLNPKTYAKK